MAYFQVSCLFYVRYKQVVGELALFQAVSLILKDLLALFLVFDFFAFPAFWAASEVQREPHGRRFHFRIPFQQTLAYTPIDSLSRE